MKTTLTLRDRLTAGFVAGLVGGVLIQAFLLGAELVRGTPPEKLTAAFVFIAATLLGPGASAQPAAVPLGIGLHFCVAVGWALGYVWAAREQPQLLARPWLSGAAFGLMVYIFMQIIVLTAGLYHRPDFDVLLIQLAAHIVFYGIPVALIASNMLRARSSGSGQAA